MRVLILGNGAREHALTWKFSKSKRISALFVAPGNAGTGEIATNLPDVRPTSAEEVIQACRTYRVDLVFIGPEDPLASGIVDALQKEKIPVIGPPAKSAQLEASKAFAKSFMVRNRIPTAEHRTFTSYPELERFLLSTPKRVVLKKSGLAAGKGVLESADQKELLQFARRTLQEDQLVVEEFLDGFETSIFVLCDGSSYQILPPCMDYKKAYDGNQGPNTGGMGSICPVPSVTTSLMNRIQTEVIKPTIEGLDKEGLTYKGVLYLGLMITNEGPKVLEYNVRFGDPETQVLLPLLSIDMGNLAEAIVTGSLHQLPFNSAEKTAVGVVIAAPGYPGTYPKGLPVELDIPKGSDGTLIFHAATQRDPKGNLQTNGGRCFTVVGIGKDIFEASVRAYDVVPRVRFDGAWYRKDIGKLLPHPI
ncbi:MAG: phosphoribosylamine--glycine ligase [Spirochaetes bacterium]|nr:phosphoribosylamine--glycine ligase [Spirochaetota bacterium]